jgi:hypothetical protein
MPKTTRLKSISDCAAFTVLPGWAIADVATWASLVIKYSHLPFRARDRSLETGHRPSFFRSKVKSATSNEFRGRRLSSDRADFEVISGLVAYRDRNQGTLCRLTTRQVLLGFKLINYETRGVIEAQRDLKYVALSYF